MREAYNDIQIHTVIDDTDFLVLNIALEHFTKSMPRHSHGNNSYEIHFIPFGYGKVYIDGAAYDITPNTLYVTGPHVEHEQIPNKENPMVEYSVYFKLQPSIGSASSEGSIAQKFGTVSFWFGQDTMDLHTLMLHLFDELRSACTGYTIQVRSMIAQLVVLMVRNYEKKKPSDTHFDPATLNDSKYLIVEERFLYDYETITLENLADTLGLSTRQTERFLKEYYGKTFRQKKAESKMSVAKMLLLEQNHPVSEVAEKLGYSSVQHFSGAFARYYGCSPRQFQKDNR